MNRVCFTPTNTIPMMAKAWIGHFAEGRARQTLAVDRVDESEVLDAREGTAVAADVGAHVHAPVHLLSAGERLRVCRACSRGVVEQLTSVVAICAPVL